GPDLISVSISKDNDILYAVSKSGVTAFSTSNDKPFFTRSDNGIDAIAASRYGDHFYQTLSEINALWKVNTGSNAVVQSWETGLYPRGIALSSDGRYAYVACGGPSAEMTIIDTQSADENTGITHVHFAGA